MPDKLPVYDEVPIPKILYHGTTKEFINAHLWRGKTFCAEISDAIDATPNPCAALAYPRYMDGSWTHTLVIIRGDLAFCGIDKVVGLKRSPQVKFRYIPGGTYCVLYSTDIGLGKGEPIRLGPGVSRKIRALETRLLQV